MEAALVASGEEAMKKPEKLCAHVGGRRTRRHHKDLVHRMRRRAERRDPENAPRHVRELVRGWV